MSFYSSETYYRILGLSTGASDNDIKQAYRLKAKQLHPDRNPSPTAHQDFIQLTEAYEYLINHHTIDTGQQYTQYNYQPTYQAPDPSSQWESKAREEARRRAEEHANMRFEDFANTDYYKSLESFSIVLRYLFILILILFVVGLCTFFIASSGPWGIFPSALFLIMPCSLIYVKLKDGAIDLTELHESGVFLFGQMWFSGIVLTAFNFYSIFSHGIKTMLPDMRMPMLYVGTMIVFLLVSMAIAPAWTVFRRFHYTLCLVPVVLSLFFTINYRFAHDPVQESYQYKIKRYSQSEIVLPQHKYDEYPNILNFSDLEEMQMNNTITYTFADGLLGARVMKGYKFETKQYEVSQ